MPVMELNHSWRVAPGALYMPYKSTSSFWKFHSHQATTTCHPVLASQIGSNGLLLTA